MDIAPGGIPAALHRAVAAHPDRTAFVAGPQSLTFAEFGRRVDAVAAALVAAGVGRGEPVGVSLDRSVALGVAIFGILRAGAAYVPVDPAHPVDRRRMVIDDAGVTRMIADPGTVDGLPATALDVRAALDGTGDADGLRLDPLPRVGADDLAYVVFTSGSTGRPKGAMITHGSVLTLADALARRGAAGPGHAVVAWNASLAFDASVQQWSRLLRGDTVVLLTEAQRREPARFVQAVRTHRVTDLDITPTHLRVMLRHLDPGQHLRILVGGEAIDGDLWAELAARHAAGQLTALNVYGPTECTVDAVLAPIVPGSRPAIGRPLPGVRARVCDPQLRSVPPGGSGELLLAGGGLAWGYARRPALTALAFVPDVAGPPGARAYRTGDLVERLPDDTLAFLGRRDGQVKIRGVRIELDEVDQALRRLDGVHDAVAVVVTGPAGATIRAVVTGPGPDPARWRHDLAASLPAAAIPTDLVTVAMLPRTASGKVDRARAAARFAAGPAAAAPGPDPGDDWESYVRRLWSTVLDRPDVGADGEFVALGGHSLSAMVVADRASRETGREVTVADVLGAPTVAGFATLLAARPPAGTARDPHRPDVHRPDVHRPDVHRPDPHRRSAPLAPQQEGLFLLHQMYPHCRAYHVPALLRIDGPLDVDRLGAAVTAVVGRHAALRTRIATAAGRPIQLIAAVAPPPGTAGGLIVHPPAPEGPGPAADEPGPAAEGPGPTGDATSELLAAAADRVREVVRRPFDLRSGPLFRAELLTVGPQTRLLVLVGHHIVVDGWSIEIIQRDIGRAYAEGATGSGGDSEPVQFATVAAAARSAAYQARVDAELDYWRHQLADLPDPVRLPFARRRPATPRFRAGRIRRPFSVEATAGLRDLAVRTRVPVFPLLILGLATVVSRYTGQHDVVLGTPVAERDGPELADSVGFYNNSLVLRLTLRPGASVRDNLRAAAHTVAEALAHRHVPFDELVRRLAPPRVPGANPIFQIWCNMLSYPMSPMRLDGAQVAALTPPVPGALFDLSAYFTEDAAGLGLDIVYDRDIFAADRIESFAADCHAVLAAFVDDPDRPLGVAELAPPAGVRSPWRGRPPADADAGGLGRRLRNGLAADPVRVVLADDHGELTAAELLQAVDATARELDLADPAGDRIVAVRARRAAALVTGLLAVLASGRTFLLLDADLPVRRQDRMLAVAGDPVVLDATTIGRRPAVQARPSTGAPPVGAPPAGGYLAFTSGSTGHPRPVMATAAPLAALVDWYPTTYQLTDADRFAVLAGIGHDPLLRELLVALAVGGSVHLPGEECLHAPHRLVGWLAAQRVTVLHLTPAQARLLAAAGQASGARLDEVRLVAFGGGAVDARDVRAVAGLCPGARIVSHYGTTETPQVAATIDYGHPSSRVDPGPASSLPDADPSSGVALIGAASPTAEIVVVGPDGRPAPANGIGELCVRSPYLALGYPGDAARTATRFLPDPYGEPGVRLYRTGDRGIRRPDATIEFRGRADRQVAVNGVRLELDEVEAVLREHPAVTDCVAMAPDDDGDGVTAYVVGDPGLTEPDLRRHLALLLPAGTPPRTLIVLDRLPLTANGKPDTAQLRRLRVAHRAAATPDSPALQVVERICAAVFGRDRLDPDTSFFDAGGSSLALIEVEARLTAAVGAAVGLSTLFANPTVRSLAAAIDRRTTATAPAVEKVSLP